MNANFRHSDPPRGSRKARKPRKYTTATLTTLALLAAGAMGPGMAGAQVQQIETARLQPELETLLAGTTNRARWVLLGPGRLEMTPSDTVRVTAYPRSTVLGTRYDQPAETAVLTYRAGASLRTLLEFHIQQLLRQDYDLLRRDLDASEGTALLEREGRGRIELSVIERQDGVYSVLLDLGATVAPEANLEPLDPTTRLLTLEGDGVRYDVYGPVQLGVVREDPRVIVLGVPATAQDVDLDEDADDGVLVRFEAPLSLDEGYEYYETLMKLQGFERRGNLRVEDNVIRGVFQRGVNRVWLQIETQGGEPDARNFEVLYDTDGSVVEAPTGRPGLIDPLFGQAIFRVEYQGVQYGFYRPADINELGVDERRVRLYVPPGALDTRFPRRGEDGLIRTVFRHPFELPRVFDAYADQLRQQGFELIDRTTEAGQVRGLYRRGDNNVLLAVRLLEDEGRLPAYLATFNLAPR